MRHGGGVWCRRRRSCSLIESEQVGAIPWLKLHTHLPVIVDPSHAAGDRRLVQPMSAAAAAVGADGIIVEVHEDPEAALCDGPQALSASYLAQYVADVSAHAKLLGKTLA